MKHLRWAHRFLRLSSTWDSSVLAQVRRGAAKGGPPPRPWLALQADSVRRLVQIAKDRGDMEQAAILAIGRLFLFRVPSECLPLQVSGDHSTIQLEDAVAVVTLSSRKHTRGPSLLRW